MYIKWWLIIASIICFTILLTIPSFGEETSSISADINIDVSTGTNFTTYIDMKVEKIYLSASELTYTAEEIADLANNNPEILGAIKYALKDFILNQLRESFKEAKITPLKELPTYEDNLFHDEYKIDLTPKFFSLNDSIDIYNLINGLLNIGGIVNYSFPLHAEEGWKNIYKFILPTHLTFKRTTGLVKNNEITWIVDNKDGLINLRKAELSLMSKKSNELNKNEDVLMVNFILNATKPEKIGLTSEMLIKNLGLKNYRISPDFIYNISGLPADGIRLCAKNGLLHWDTIYERTLSSQIYRIKKVLENSSLNQSIELNFSWDPSTTTDCKNPYNVSHMDETPPVKGILRDEEINLTIHRLPARAVFGLVNAGAKVNLNNMDINFGDHLGDIKLPYNCTFILPDHIFINGENPYRWNENHSLNGEMYSDIAPIYSEEKIDTHIDFSIEDMDLNLLSFFSGRTEISTGLYLEEKENRSVSKIPYTFHIPSEINISLLNSDAFRICIEEGVFKENEVKTFLNDEASLFKILIEEILPGADINVKSNVDKFQESLKWDEDISIMDGNKPISIISTSHVTYPLSFNFSIIPPSFKVLPWNLTLRGIRDQNVTYRLIFPDGIYVMANDSLGKTSTKKIGNHYLIEINFNKEEANSTDYISIKMQPSLLFIIGLFSPCLLSIIVASILFILIYILRRKRRRIYPSQEQQRYEEQEYYIPPPPQNLNR
ncbi:MAG: hypothetical protein DRN12_00080 [Thermoplasmata archaeon]|nr:MAG: hypothetical protein DRN12_00080 [Thermoplasmata archaeon]